MRIRPRAEDILWPLVSDLVPVGGPPGAEGGRPIRPVDLRQYRQPAVVAELLEEGLDLIIALFPLLLFSLVSAGCVAAGAAAGGAAGAQMAGDEDREDLEYWLKTNDTTTRIGRAMREERLAKGMKPTHVKLVMATKRRFEALPTSRDTVGSGMTWTYEANLSRHEGYEIVFNAEPTVEEVNRTEPECDPTMTARSGREPC